MSAEPVAPPRLSDRTTLRLGGPAADWLRATTERELVDAVAEVDRSGRPVLLLGGGSNLVVSDEGFDGLVVEIATTGIEAEGDACGGAMVTVAGGE